MKDSKGNVIRNGHNVDISANAVKKYNLPNDAGTVTDSGYNAEQLVRVSVSSIKSGGQLKVMSD